MTTQTELQSSDIYEKLDKSTINLESIRNSDFKMLIGQELNDISRETKIYKVEATSININRGNLELDGTISLEIGITVSWRQAGEEPGDEKTTGEDDGELWITTDGVITQITLDGVDGAEYLDFDIQDFGKIFGRFKPQK